MSNEFDAQEKKTVEPEFGIQRIYIKDLSFESPQVPSIFQQAWKPELNLQLHVDTTKLDKSVYEVALQATVTATQDDKTVFIAEVKLAGIFTLQNFPEEQVPPTLGVACPAILFPYVRETISDMVIRATFPPLHLSPVNFEVLYAQQLQKQTEEAGAGEGTGEIITH